LLATSNSGLRTTDAAHRRAATFGHQINLNAGTLKHFNFLKHSTGRYL